MRILYVRFGRSCDSHLREHVIGLAVGRRCREHAIERAEVADDGALDWQLIATEHGDCAAVVTRGVAGTIGVHVVDRLIARLAIRVTVRHVRTLGEEGVEIRDLRPTTLADVPGAAGAENKLDSALLNILRASSTGRTALCRR